MPDIYLNPSNSQDMFIGGGTEEYYMNLIADAMTPYLRANGIAFSRSNPGTSVNEAILEANEGNFDLFLGIRTKTIPDETTGFVTGPDVAYFAFDPRSQMFAEFLSSQLKEIYPFPELVVTVPNRTLMELQYSDAVAALAVLGYRDNMLDVQWIKNNIPAIGRALAYGVINYLGMSAIDPYTQHVPLDKKEVLSHA